MTSKQQMRYAHSEGHLDLCYDDTGDNIITCGPDGDVRIYHGFDDDDPISHRIGDVVYCVAYKNKKLYTASDDNSVRAITFKDGQPDGILTRFTAHGTHFCFNRSGSRLIAGASDFLVKIVDIESSKQKVLSGHEAPILSVSLHPDEMLVASSSCDGTVRVWNVEDQKLVKAISCLPKSSDFCTSKTLCRITWDLKGEYLFVPVSKKILAYDVQTWSMAFELTDSSLTEVVSIASLSPCGLYLAGATRNGLLIVWNLGDKKCVIRERHEKGLTITGLAWHPHLLHLAYCDDHGYLGVLNNMSTLSVSGVQSNQNDVVQGSDLFDDNDDGLLMDAAATGDDIDDDYAASGAIPGIDTDVDDDDSCSEIHAEKPSSADDAASVAGTDIVTAAKPFPNSRGWEPVALQRPFQSSSSPVGLSARFMVWNDVGVIIQYSSEDEQSVNVEFHDTATHHAIHVNNTLAHCIADLSGSAVLLACEADENTPSQLVCMHFGSWDNCKEWSTSMPDGEDIQMVCLGDDWLAVATDRRLVRIFSISGIQKQIFSLSGPVVTMAAHRDMLIVVYHNGLGVPGDQCLAFQLISVSRKTVPRCVDRLPLSSKSTLAWLRFSEAGTPFSVDSSGVVRMLSRSFSHMWVEVANLQQHCKGKTDNMWIVGINENQQHIRAVMCKGSKYPPVLPRPTVLLLPFQIPLCELSTDKGNLESSMLQTMLFSEQFSHNEVEGLDCIERYKSQYDVTLQECLMKLFALACKSGREVRATELCKMMSSSRTVQLAIKYATRLHLIQLAERLGDVARIKAEEETQLEASDYYTNSMMDGMSNVISKRMAKVDNRHLQANAASNANYSDEDEDANDDNDDDVSKQSNDTVTPRGLLILRKKDDKDQPPKSLSDSQSDKRNPFKVASNKVLMINTPIQVKGTSVFDSMEKQKLGRLSASSGKTSASETTEIFAQNEKKSISQVKLPKIARKHSMSKLEIVHKEKNEISTFEMWFEANKEALTVEFGDSCDETELTVKAMHKYRQLIKVLRSTNENVSTEDDTGCRKRKRDDTVDSKCKTPDCSAESSIKDATGNGLKKADRKLSSFMYNKNC